MNLKICFALFSLAILASAHSYADDLQQAQTAIEKSQYQKAALLLQRALLRDPDNAQAFDLLEKAFLVKIERQRIEDNLQKYIQQKNLMAAKSQFTLLKKKEPFNPNLKKYQEEITQLEKNARFSPEQLGLSKRENATRQKLLSDGKQALKEKKFTRAMQLFQELLTLAPGDLEAKSGFRQAEAGLAEEKKQREIARLYQLGLAHYQEKKLPQAERTITDLLKINNRHKEGIELLSKIRKSLREMRERDNLAIQAENFYRDGISLMKEKKYNDAINSFRDANAIIPEYKDAVQKIAEARRLQKEQYLQNERQLAEKIAEHIQNGLAAFYAEDYQGAIAHLNNALAIDSNNEQARTVLSRAQEAMRIKSEESIDQHSPFYPLFVTISQKAYSLYQQGNYLAAKKEWNEILRLFPKNRIAIQETLRIEKYINPTLFRTAANKVIREGKELLKKNKPKHARRNFELIYNIDPNFPEIRRLIGQSSQVEKKADAPKLPLTTLRNYYETAMNHYKNRRYKQAISLFQLIVKNNPRDFQAAAALARTQKMLSINPNAVATRTSRLTPTEERKVRQLYILGLTHYSNNQYQRAMEAWRQVLSIDPNHSKAKSNLLKVQRLLRF